MSEYIRQKFTVLGRAVYADRDLGVADPLPPGGTFYGHTRAQLVVMLRSVDRPGNLASWYVLDDALAALGKPEYVGRMSHGNGGT